MSTPKPEDINTEIPGGIKINFTGPEAVGALGLVSIVVGIAVQLLLDDAQDWTLWLFIGIGVVLIVVAVVMRFMGAGSTPKDDSGGTTQSDPTNGHGSTGIDDS